MNLKKRSMPPATGNHQLGADVVMYEMGRTGNTIKYLRTTQNKSQECVSAEMGINIKTYRAIEQGTRGGNIDTLCLIAEYFNVTLDYLINGSAKHFNEIERRLGALDPTKQETALRLFGAIIDNL